jgi:hypothetical protein
MGNFGRVVLGTGPVFNLIGIKDINLASENYSTYNAGIPKSLYEN